MDRIELDLKSKLNNLNLNYSFNIIVAYYIRKGEFFIDYEMESKSDSDSEKENFRDLIRQSHINARLHERYCLKYCNFANNHMFTQSPHSPNCHEMAKDHYNSFVNCNSPFCIDYCKKYDLTPSYHVFKKKPKFQSYLEFGDDNEE